MKFTVLATFLIFFSINAFSQKLMVEVDGIRNNVGWIRLAFFRNESDFRAERPVLVRIVDKSLLLDGNMTIKLDSIPPGIYGIALLDDENKNGKLDYKFILPKEGVGFSNFVQKGLSRPRFSDFSFVVRKDAVARPTIHMTYY